MAGPCTSGFWKLTALVLMVTTAAVTAQVCPADYVVFNEVCYKDFDVPKSFSEARQTCAADGGLLAMPRDSATNTFIHELAGVNERRWIGLSDANTEGQWVYEDGQPLASGGYNNWLPGEPNDSWGNEDCAELINPSHDWNDIPCDRLEAFICQQEMYSADLPKKWRDDFRCGPGYPDDEGNPAECNPYGSGGCCSNLGWCGGPGAAWCECSGCIDYRMPGCPADYVRFHGACYKDFDDQKSISEARQTCHIEGGLLAMPKNSATNAYIHELAGVNERRWIGLTDENTEGHWVYEDGQTLASSGYSNWNSGEPNDEFGHEDCAEVIGGLQHYWNDVPCNNHISGFVCQLDIHHFGGPRKWRGDYRCGAGFPDDEGNPAECNTYGFLGCCSPHQWCGGTAAHCECSSCVDYREPGCPADYVRFNDACYKDFDVPKSFYEAKETCFAEGGLLAMPTDSATNIFIHELAGVSERRWIGLTDEDTEGQWVYEDGQTLASSGYSNWNSGEPNNEFGNEDCAEVIGGVHHYWNDVPCGRLEGFICQLEMHFVVHGDWSSWGTWSGCSVTCGVGTQTRDRTCTNPAPANGGADCVGQTQETRQCNTWLSCPVDGGWSSWGSWSSCSVTCGSGTQTRYRSCNNPAPANGGANCVGGTQETRQCTRVSCPVDGGWSSWSTWSGCSVTCGVGTEIRDRTCTNPAPANGGEDCVGQTRDTQQCDTGVSCPVDGGWSDWGPWSDCSVTCGVGTQTRDRACTNPAPANGGEDCVGQTQETRQCDTGVPCPVDGGWSDWGPWSDCSVTCGVGTETRDRTCTNPAPVNGGADCVGQTQETRQCDTGVLCPVNGGWSDWGAWSDCSVTCGVGTQTRDRTCTNPPPANGGEDCVGQTQETRQCDTGVPCPVDGDWSDWGAWSDCSVTCGSGTQTRDRTCTNPAPMYSGADCVGETQETRQCDTGVSCPVPCPEGYGDDYGFGKCLYVHKRPLIYPQAKAICEDMGGKIFQLDNAEDVNRLKNIVKRARNPRHFGIWVGLTDETTEGTFVWADGTPLVSGDFADWAPQPYEHNNAWRDCVLMKRKFNWQWVVRRCRRAKNLFLCEPI